MSKRIFQIIDNMRFFCKLANLKEFKYPTNSFKELSEHTKDSIIFPGIGYYETHHIKFRYSKILKVNQYS